MALVPGDVNLEIAPPTAEQSVSIAPPSGAPEVILVPTPGQPGPPGSPGAGWIHTQEIPQSVVVLEHNLGRDGPIAVSAYSLDYELQYDGFVIQIVNQNVAYFVSDTPVSGHFLVL